MHQLRNLQQLLLLLRQQKVKHKFHMLLELYMIINYLQRFKQELKTNQHMINILFYFQQKKYMEQILFYMNNHLKELFLQLHQHLLSKPKYWYYQLIQKLYHQNKPKQVQNYLLNHMRYKIMHLNRNIQQLHHWQLMLQFLVNIIRLQVYQQQQLTTRQDYHMPMELYMTTQQLE